MRNIGIVRKTDSLNRLVIPVELCRTYDIPEGTPMEIYTSDDGEIILKKYAPGCTFCGGMDDLKDFKGKHVCKKCRGEIKL